MFRERAGRFLVRVGLAVGVIGLSGYSADLSITGYIANKEYSDVLGNAIPEAQKTVENFETAKSITKEYLSMESAQQLENAPPFIAAQTVISRNQERLNRQNLLQGDRKWWELGAARGGVISTILGMNINRKRF